MRLLIESGCSKRLTLKKIFGSKLDDIFYWFCGLHREKIYWFCGRTMLEPASVNLDNFDIMAKVVK